MRENVLELRSISRSFTTSSQQRIVVDDLSLHVPAGSIVCLLGPNGAGKTTTIKMASTLLEPDSGQVSICGVDAVRDPRQARSHLSLCLGGERGFYLRATAIDNMRFFATLAGVPFKDMDARITEALRQVNLLDKAHDKVETFSRGMCQRLHLARALCQQAELILLDEPTTGLDVESAVHVRELVAVLRDQGRAIVLTTHTMSEAEALADFIYIINHGTIIASGTVEELAQSINLSGVSMYAFVGGVEGSGDDAGDIDLMPLAALDGVRNVDSYNRDGVTHIALSWSGPTEPSQTEVYRALAGRYGSVSDNDAIRYMGSRPASLEEVYLAIVHEDDSRAEERGDVKGADAGGDRS